MEFFLALFVLICGLVCIALPLLKHRWLMGPVILALVCRFVAAVTHRYIFALPEGRSDAVRFDSVALEWAYQHGCTGFFEHFDPSASYVYSSLLATFYGCLGYSPFGAQVINVFLGTGSVILLGLAVFNIWGKRESRVVAYLLALFPFLVMFSAVTLRESFIIFFFSLGIYAFVIYSSRKKVAWLMVSFLAFYCSSLFHGAMLLAIPAIVICLAIDPLMRRSTNHYQYIQRILAFFTIFILATLAIFYVYVTATIHKLGDLSSLSAEDIALVLSNRATGGAAYLENLSVDGFDDLIWQAPIRVAYFLFSPFPWDIRSAQHVFGMLDGLVYLTVVILLIRHRQVLFKNPMVLKLLIIVAVLAIVFAFGTSNFGTAIRHRSKFMIVLLVVTAPALSGLLRKRFAYRERIFYRSG